MAQKSSISLTCFFLFLTVTILRRSCEECILWSLNYSIGGNSMYRVQSRQYQFHFTGWWEMIDFLSRNENRIAHNSNDCYSYYDCGKFSRVPPEKDIVNQAIDLLLGIYDNHKWIERRRTIEQRDLFVYDEYDTLVNLYEIREALSVYVPRYTKKKKVYHNIYRVDPVPKSGKHYYNRCRTSRVNLKYYKDAMSYIHDSRIRTQFGNRLANYYEDYFPRFSQRSWKKHRKTQYKSIKLWI